MNNLFQPNTKDQIVFDRLPINMFLFYYFLICWSFFTRAQIMRFDKIMNTFSDNAVLQELTPSSKSSCLNVCKNNNQCSGYFFKDDQCYTLDQTNQFNTASEDGTNYYKKILQENFAKEALLQSPGTMNCLLDSNNADGSCAYPYKYKDANKYACIDGCSDQYQTIQVNSYIWQQSSVSTLDTELNTGECKHQCSVLGSACQSVSWDSSSKSCSLSANVFDPAPDTLSEHVMTTAWSSSHLQSPDFAVDKLHYFTAFTSGAGMDCKHRIYPLSSTEKKIFRI